MAETLHVETRKSVGKRNNIRLRRAGRVPAVLYGHGEESVNLALSADECEASLRHGAKVVDLDGAASGKALLQDVQWDTFFHQVLHVDLLRVRAGERPGQVQDEDARERALAGVGGGGGIGWRGHTGTVAGSSTELSAVHALMVRR